MRQSGVLAACGIVSLMDWREKLEIDNKNASWMAHELAEIKGVVIDPTFIETNIVRFTFEKSLLSKMKTDYFGFSKKLKDEK